MSHPPDLELDSRATGATALRTVGFVLAIALGILSVWLIVTSDSVKWMRVGALAGFWGLLVGGFAIFGRHLQHPAGTAAMSASELALRGTGVMDRAEDAAARHEFERQLMAMLRHEVHSTMGAEMQRMRDEVIALRHELVEKFHGDLRMERIETTRVFGSDIEALQQEINQLKAVRGAVEAGRWSAEPTHADPVSPRTNTIVEAEVIPDAPSPTVVQPTIIQPTVVRSTPAEQPTPAQPVPVEPVPAEAAAGLAARTVDERPSPASGQLSEWPTMQMPAATRGAPAEAASSDSGAPSVDTASRPNSGLAPEPVQPAAAPRPATPAPTMASAPLPAVHLPTSDDFASLPRITPFLEFELDSAPLPVPPVQSPEHTSETAAQARAGRRRAADAPGGPDSGGRRRREGESEGNDLLSQILARETGTDG